MKDFFGQRVVSTDYKNYILYLYTYYRNCMELANSTVMNILKKLTH